MISSRSSSSSWPQSPHSSVSPEKLHWPPDPSPDLHRASPIRTWGGVGPREAEGSAWRAGTTACGAPQLSPLEEDMETAR